MPVSLAPPAHCSTELEFEVHPPVSGSSPAAPYELFVRLSPGLISTEASGTRVDRNFASRRLLETDSAEKTTRDDSLFAVLAFRVAELENRKMIARVLSQVGQEEEMQHPAVLDHIFSLDSGSSPQVDRRPSSDGVGFYCGERCLAEYSTQGTPASPETVSQFAMFLRHEYGLHPKILSELQSLSYLPSEIVVCLQDPSEASHKLKLKSAKPASPPSPPASFPPPADHLYELATKTSQMSSEEKKSAHAAMLESASVHAAAGRNLEAMLLFMSYSASTGETPSELASMREQFTADSGVKVLLGAVRPPDESSAKKALVALKGLEDSVSDGKPMLKVFRANITAALGAPAPATELFLEALEIEPTLAGAWFDLGAAYHAGFDTRSAWKCYDVGRQVAPLHPASAEVEKLEDALRKEHPEFFM